LEFLGRFVARRILHIIDSLGRTGRATQLLVLSQGLAKAGWEVHVAALRDNAALSSEFRTAGISVVKLQRRWRIDPVAFAQLHRYVNRLQPDVIHTWSDSVTLYGQLVARRVRLPALVVGRYELDPYVGSLQQYAERRLLRHADRVVVDSCLVRDSCYRQGIPADKLKGIDPGIAPSRVSDVSREELLRELRLPDDAKLIGVVGRLTPEKRVRDLIWAADLLRVLHDNLRLLVIGDGPLRDSLTQYARLASDLEHIQFLGERADVWRIMPHLDVLWNASENRRHSISVLEAMAAGVPVIASDTPLNRELVVDSETGFLIPLHERSGRADRARHTDRIFTDGALAARLGAAARRRISERFTAEQMVSAYTALYR
jgi:glycosyltransferase involved in cell wall biosynthesis